MRNIYLILVVTLVSNLLLSCSKIEKENKDARVANRFDYIRYNGFLIGQPGKVAVYDESKILREPFKSIYFDDIPKIKEVGGRKFYYRSPRYVYNDPSGKWLIYERPKGIFTYLYDGWRAFRIDFFDDTIFIKSIDLKVSNPYSKRNYPSITERAPDNTDEKEDFPQTQLLVNKKVSELASKAYTHIVVWESDENYVIIDYCFIGYDKKGNYIGEEHTLSIVNNQGIQKGRIVNIQRHINGAIATHMNKYISYILTYPEFQKGSLIIFDLENKTELFNSDKMDIYFSANAPVTISKDSNSLAPYLNSDSCYLLLTGSSKCRGTSPNYVDIENRIIYTGCYTDEEWSQFDWPKGHYKIINDNKQNSIKF